MDGEHFDHLVSRLGAAGTRRRLLRFSALPLVAGLAAFFIDDEESAAKKKKRKKKKCPSKQKVCAGKCGTVTYKCNGKKKTANCGSCECDVCASGCDFTSVQDAIDAADPGDTIRLCLETFTENITIGKDLTIVGSHALLAQTTLQGTGNGSVIEVEYPATVSLAWLWITGGNAYAAGGIFNDGTLTLQNCAIFGNASDSGGGGGISNGDSGGGIPHGGTLEMTDCAVFDNTAAWGGGIDNIGTLEMTGCSVFNNAASAAVGDGGEGGGITNSGTLTLSNSTVSGNTASSSGGGIYNLASVTLKAGTTVTENRADNNGGGIFNNGFVNGGTSTCSGFSSVSGNTPNNCVAVNGGSCGSC